MHKAHENDEHSKRCSASANCEGDFNLAGNIRWTSFDLIFFDCDSTLSAIEGVDELARLKGKEGRVGLLTQKAMDGDLDLSEVYDKRLRAIRHAASLPPSSSYTGITWCLIRRR
jgi:hypothetical protein